MRDERAAELVDGGGMALWATGVDDEDALADMVRGLVKVRGWRNAINAFEARMCERACYVIPTRNPEWQFPTRAQMVSAAERVLFLCYHRFGLIQDTRLRAILSVRT